MLVLAAAEGEDELPGIAKFGGNGKADEDDDDSCLLSLIEKFAGGGDIGPTFGRLIVKDGEIGSQSDVSISTASKSVVGVACVVKWNPLPAEGRLAIVPKFTGARSLDNLFTPCVSTVKFPFVSAVVVLLLPPLLLLVTSATVVIIVRTTSPPLPPGSISV